MLVLVLLLLLLLLLLFLTEEEHKLLPTMSRNILQMRQGNIEAVAAIYKKGKVAKKCMIDRVNGSFYSRNESQFVCLNL